MIPLRRKATHRLVTRGGSGLIFSGLGFIHTSDSGFLGLKKLLNKLGLSRARARAWAIQNDAVWLNSLLSKKLEPKPKSRAWAYARPISARNYESLRKEWTGVYRGNPWRKGQAGRPPGCVPLGTPCGLSAPRLTDRDRTDWGDHGPMYVNS
jgi:hypothetical protein